MAFEALYSLDLSHFQSHILLFPPQILSNIQLLLPSNLQGPLRHLLFAHTAPSAWNETGQPVRTTVKSVAFRQGQHVKKLC